ncbi:MAG: tetratricopeptide repeat protein [Pseudomonadota bacterium]
MIRTLAAFALAALLAAPTAAQEAVDPATLADVRAELDALGATVAALRAQLVSTGRTGAGVPAAADPLVRLDTLEAELRRLTGQVERLQNDVRRMAEDGGRRYGDLDFRLTELEGGDLAALGGNVPLGGGLTPAPETGAGTPGAGTGGPQVAATERFAFEDARALLEAGDTVAAAEAFRRFLSDYPDGPLTIDARYFLAESQFGTSDWNSAARNYLEAFSGAPEGPLAPDALLRLGIALGRLGQFDEACLTLDETERRFPARDATYFDAVRSEKEGLGCP